VLTFHLLGEVTIALDNRPISSLGSRSAEALLIFLACDRRPLARELLAELFWPERNPEQSAANLRAALSMLRKQVGDYLLVTRQTVAFNSALPFRIDAETFQQAAESADTPLAAARIVLEQYGGDFLHGFFLRDSFAFDEWTTLRREQISQRAIALLRSALDRWSTPDDLPFLLACADKLLQLDPLSEWAQRQKMGLLLRSGRFSAALQQFQACRQMLADELGVEPALETTRLAGRISRVTQVPRHNLPPPPTPFVGRQRELDDLVPHLLRPDYRLVTLIGPGGAGKTRLALEAARRLIPTGYFVNGLRFVSLAEAERAALVSDLVAAALDIPLRGEAPAAQQLAAALADQELLLVLDDLEQVMEGADGEVLADWLADLLQHAPDLTLLVTSRRRIGLHEEWLFDLDGLPFPAQDAGEAGLETEAVQLFLQVAERVQRHFRPNSADLAAINTLCHTLEGLPLGIELAASQVRHLRCGEILAALQHNIALLASRVRNIPPRHRSLIAVFDHARALLPAAVQPLLPRLALFRGGFSADAAHTVSGASPADLALLADHSLLRHDEGRHALHPLLRQWLAEQLAATGAQATISAAHADWFFRFLAAQGDGESPEARAAIGVELPNIRAAWQHAIAGRDGERLRVAGRTLHSFFSSASRFQEGIALLQEALQPADDGSVWLPPRLHADLLGRIGRMQSQIGRLQAAHTTLQQGLALLEGQDDPLQESILLGYVAITTFHAGDFEQAAALIRQSLHLSQRLEDEEGISFALNFLGTCLKALGRYDEATEVFTQALDLTVRMGDDLARAMLLNNLGNLAQAQGDFAAAQRHYLACSELFRVLDHQHGVATTLSNAGRLATQQGDPARGRALLEESLALKRQMQDQRGMAVALIGLANASAGLREEARAQAELAEALPLAHQAGDVKLVLEGIAVGAALAAQRGSQESARQLVRFVLAHQATAREVRDAVTALQNGLTGLEGQSADTPDLTLDGAIALVLRFSADIQR
jgi:DNA-binding SARP family transcriptional activator/predicted ATPase